MTRIERAARRLHRINERLERVMYRLLQCSVVALVVRAAVDMIQGRRDRVSGLLFAIVACWVVLELYGDIRRLRWLHAEARARADRLEAERR